MALGSRGRLQVIGSGRSNGIPRTHAVRTIRVDRQRMNVGGNIYDASGSRVGHHSPIAHKIVGDAGFAAGIHAQ